MTTYAPVDTNRIDRSDGSIVLSASQPLEPHAPSIIHDFRSQSERRPNESLIVERRDGAWVHHSWSSIRREVDALAQAMIDRSLTSAPTLVLGGPSRLHLVAMLASMSVGTAVTSASVAYSLQSSDHAQLRHISSIIKPGLVVADNDSFAAAVAATHASTVLTERGDIEGSVALDDLTTTAVTEAVDDAVSRLTADTVAKYLFSSGSTGAPERRHHDSWHARRESATDTPGLAVSPR